VEGRRYYVIDKRASTNEIVIAERDEALKQRITVGAVNCFVPLESLEDSNPTIKYRYNSPRIAAEIVDAGRGRITFLTAEPCFAPAPGQIVACYRGDALVCGGVIESAA
jgi:tRNA U34 2-thiouridine synthase MnmA/TrmU